MACDLEIWVIKSTLEKLPEDLTSEQRQQVIDLLRDYQDVFSKGTFDMGRTASPCYSGTVV